MHINNAFLITYNYLIINNIYNIYNIYSIRDDWGIPLKTTVTL